MTSLMHMDYSPESRNKHKSDEQHSGNNEWEHFVPPTFDSFEKYNCSYTALT